MKLRNKIAAVLTAIALTVSLSGCFGPNEEFTERKEGQAKALENSLEKENLKRKLELENDPNRIGYVYIFAFNAPIGYFVSKGKVSSSGSQLAPEQDIVQPYSGGERYVVDSAQDDGTYGTGDPGVFFFTADGTYISTDLPTLYMTQPLALNVPQLYQDIE